MPSADYYQILGVSRKARSSDIKKAYKRLARKCHPDLNPNNRAAEDQFKRITEAYEVLSDPEKRRRYDQTGRIPGSSPFQSGSPGDGAPSPDFEFSSPGFGGGFSDIFAEIFGEGPRSRNREPRPGEDRVHPMRIGFFDALQGLVTTLQVEVEEACVECAGTGTTSSSRGRVCPDCQGSGRVERLAGRIRFTPTCRRCGGTGRLQDEPCSRCRGSGKTPRMQSIRIRIPAGVDTGSRVRIPGKGGAGILGGPPGDLYIQIQVESHPFFSRAGDQILCSLPITFSEAGLGAKVEVPTMDGPSTIRIPPGTQSGQKFRLKGKGAPSLRGGGRGDQIVEVRVVTPDARDERTRSLLRQLSELEQRDLRSHLGSHS
jgi:molecular chaperone DnaJ